VNEVAARTFARIAGYFLGASESIDPWRSRTARHSAACVLLKFQRCFDDLIKEERL
jgi:hypothetical protein